MAYCVAAMISRFGNLISLSMERKYANIILPAKGFTVHPPSVQTEDLFNYITGTSLPSGKRRDIVCYGFNFFYGIGRTTGHPHLCHYLIIREVIPHIKHLFRFQIIFEYEVFEIFQLVG